MRKTWTIAVREYNAAVRTKAFLISIILLPVMMFGGVGLSAYSQKYAADTRLKKVAVIDRTDGHQLFDVLKASAERRNNSPFVTDASGRQLAAKFELSQVPASAADDSAIRQQHFDLAEKIRSGELFAYLDIGAGILSPATAPGTISTTDPTAGVYYASNTPTYTNVLQWAQQALSEAVTQRKIETLGIDRNTARALLSRVSVDTQALPTRDQTGNIVVEPPPDLVATLVRPVACVMLMFVIVLVGSSPMSMNIMEEKQQRIAEVMLGSVRPFELMMGKLLGGVGVALTLMAIYFGGAFYAAGHLGYAQYVQPKLLGWFLAFCVVAVFMYGSVFLAVGSAVNNAREAQSLITPVMLMVVLPMMALSQVMQAPDGMLSRILSFFPPSAPMITMARMTIPPGVPAWQPLVSLLAAGGTAVAVIWCAGRIFRVGILLQGKPPKLIDLARWVIRG